MFPLHQGNNEFSFQISSNTNQQRISEDLIHYDIESFFIHGSDDYNNTNGDNNINENTSNGKIPRRRKNTSMDHKNGVMINTIGDDDKRKIVHRDIERQRRQEMTTLHSSLRSLLPLEHVKGKRSVSDHVHEAVNYIGHLQRSIKNLSTKRDDLKRVSSSILNSSQIGIGSSDDVTSSNYHNSVTVQPCLGGMEILFRSGLGGQRLTLSRVLYLLIEEGISIVNCVSTKVNDAILLHTIQTEVDDPTSLNLPELVAKLNAINFQ